MSQLYLKDSGAMIHQGKTALEYQTEPMWSWDPAFHSIADSPQIFPSDWEGVQMGERILKRCWLFVPHIGQFFRREGRLHPILAAAKTLFTAERWEEIEDLLDELGDVNKLMRNKEFSVLRRKIARARDKGFITQAEFQSLKDVASHLPNGG
jgi:hypothetical protein